MRRLIIAGIAAASITGPAPAGVITDFFTSFYVLGDSLSDDGNVTGTLWLYVTGGSPYQGNWVDGGTFTNGDVWNEPLQNKFRNAGRDADNFAVGSAQSSGGNWLIPDLDDQIDKLFDYTSSGDRGKNSLVSILIGGNNILDKVGSGDAVETAIDVARTIAKGIKRMADKGIDEFLVFNLPDLGKIPKYRLFKPQDKDEARAAGKAFNDKLAKRIASLEKDGINIIDIDLFKLFNDVIKDPDDYGFSNVKLPCVFPSEDEAEKYDRPERCSPSMAEDLLFMDDLHPTALAHSIIGDVVKDALKAEALARTSHPLALRATDGAMSQPLALRATVEAQLVTNPLPGSASLLVGAVGLVAVVGARQRRASRRLPRPISG